MLCSRSLLFVLSSSLAAALAGCKTGGPESGSLVKDAPATSAADGACAGMEPSGDPVAWLKGLNQFQLRRAFECAQAPATLPLGVGKGSGTLVQGLALFNGLQMSTGAHIWGGKRFFEEDGGVKLVNLMIDNGTERYNARVYSTTSILDGKPIVVLDYRIDDSIAAFGAPGTPMQKGVDKIVRGIRDEIRELRSGGQGTGVYVGRAHLYLPYFLPLADRSVPPTEAAFNSPASWLFAANFVLDFRGQ